MNVETKWLIEELRKRQKESNSYGKAMYSKQIKNLEAGRCPYGCVDWKKIMEEDKKKYL